MGAQQCSKCGVMLDYYEPGFRYLGRNQSCRVHTYNTLNEKLMSDDTEKKICQTCDNTGNCKHSFRHNVCGIWC
jgi:hypothetical protein